WPCARTRAARRTPPPRAGRGGGTREACRGAVGPCRRAWPRSGRGSGPAPRACRCSAGGRWPPRPAGRARRSPAAATGPGAWAPRQYNGDLPRPRRWASPLGRDTIRYVTGTLGLFSLVDLFQLLSSARRSGRLTIDHPRGRGRVYFEKGVVVHADFAGLVGEEAVYALFADERGTFEFRIGMPAPEQTVTTSTENLVLEAVRRLD